MKLRKPIDGNLAKLRVNRTLHGRSVFRREDVDGHNVFLGYKRPGIGDGIDLFVPAGTPIRAMHAGKVSRLTDRDDKLSCCYIVGEQDDRQLITCYAHLHFKDDLDKGDSVVAGQVIGYVGRLLKDPHLHLEVWVNGCAVSGKTAREYRADLVEMTA